ncbi:MAG TPA: divergent polysaccharide deacetylase family protein [Spirochaetota bacterium]|nr:divergent polysaccharide deacetylase family protein [Spirochaetota bacterium]
MPQKKVIKKRTPRKKNRKSYTSLLFIIITTATVIIALFFLYLFLYYPKALTGDVKKEVISFLSPQFSEEDDDIIIIKLNEENKNKIDNLSNHIFNKFGIKIHNEEIKKGNKVINKILLYKNNYNILDIKPIYIYYDVVEKNENPIIQQKEDDIKEIKEIKNQKHKINSIHSNKDKVVLNKENEKEVILNNKNKIVLNKKIEEKVILNNKNKKLQENRINKIKPYKISIVIDDIGYDNTNIYEFLKLEIPITFAIIPELPNSKKSYDLIISKGFDTILHIPMEPEKGEEFVEKNGLFFSLSDEELEHRINKFISLYPKVIGANNHMGSKAVTDERIMNILHFNLYKKGLFWLDSYTNQNSISDEVAKKYNIKHFKRDVFLDNQKDYFNIKKSFMILIKEAKIKNYAIGIGHVQSKELIIVLKEFQLNADFYKIEFVGIKDLE